MLNKPVRSLIRRVFRRVFDPVKGSAPVVGTWLLLTSIWDDAGVWDDTATWNDGV